ncbi:MAG TPA: DUF481 domain-containing protein [Gemmatimonadaceae bacterium]|nr:DUF481 domain-containing protein [Gemmatimonadaceae bacterium]
MSAASPGRRGPRGPSARLLARLTAIVVALAPLPAAAQDLGWSIENELSGSLFFGNTRQTLFTGRTAVARADSAYELKGSVRFTYGESSNEDDGAYVSKRSWLGSLNYDHRPLARWSTFLISTLETSLEKRIDFRYDFGFGEKLTFVRTATTRADISVAILGERTYLPQPVLDATENLLRWSGRARYQRQMNDRVRVSHETAYRPVVDDFGRFTLRSTTSVAIQLASFANLNVSFLDNYDSEARRRGARSNNDGQLVLGLLTSF